MIIFITILIITIVIIIIIITNVRCIESWVNTFMFFDKSLITAEIVEKHVPKCKYIQSSNHNSFGERAYKRGYVKNNECSL